MEKPIHIAVVPGVGYSHLNPILQFSKLLVHLHPHFHVTCFIPSLGSLPTDSKTILQTLPSNIHCYFLPPLDPKNLPLQLPLELQLQFTVNHSLPSLHQVLKTLTLKTPFVAMIVDSFAVEALDLAKEFNMLSYVYFPSAVTTLSSYFHLIKLDKVTSCEYRDLPEPVKIPGCVPIHGRDLVVQAQDRLSQSYKFLLKRVERFRLVDGVIINSFLEMEIGVIRALVEEGSGNPVVYPVGPIIQQDTQQGHDLECLAWLDKQQPCSVLFVSFGSGGTLSQEQIFELALGLELSDHRFLWVMRAPSNLANAAYLSGGKDGVDPLQFLPSGFLDRTKEKGLVIPLWAPQIQILSHSSVGGFLSHCGWNSVLESVMHGVPLITWPLFAEQRMNAVVLSEGLKVGVRPRVNENGIVEREEIVKVIKCLMEGEEGGTMRDRMKELKNAANNAIKEDGSSIKTLSQLALKLRNLAFLNKVSFMNLDMEKTIHIAVVPGVGFGHLVPILQFTKLLVHLHPFIHVTCLIPTLGSPPSALKTILQTLPSNINYTFLLPVDPNDLPQETLTLEMKSQLIVTLSLPYLHQALKSLALRTPLVALVADSFAVEALNFAKDFNMLSYIYFTSAATTLSFSFYFPKLDEETSCEYRDLPEPIKIPGCIPLHGSDLLTPAQDRSSQAYKHFLQHSKSLCFADGVLVNSFLEMEMGPIKALTEEGSGNPAVYPIGPIIQTGTKSGSDVGNGKECLTWLDKQKPCSVLYVSFGSGGTLSQEQTVELALGLELSNHRFLWVVRAPNNSANAAYFSTQDDDVDPLKFLPSGFLERTKEKGLVIPSWAPQIQILSHSSVGGFLSHCGWNSCLESVMHGVPLITWPLFAEQRMNAALLSEGLKVGVRPRVNENGIVERVEIVKVIKCLMEEEEGRNLCNNMKELKDAAINALKENGPSTKTIYQLTLKWRNLV
uniref:Uncharacterized protein LOC101504804 n=3 Tax=Cicer arietinum TaxID=3827 RepID=A0A3Q7YC63_CICAR|nr:uncharacterized protein LOC101504804 [Cicer arietinum]